MRNMRGRHYEADEKEFAGAFQVKGWRGVAFRVLGWETRPNEDTEWSGIEERTGRVVAVMVGDDTHHAVDPEDLTRLKRSEYCGGCGQIGCRCDTGGEEDTDE